MFLTRNPVLANVEHFALQAVFVVAVATAGTDCPVCADDFDPVRARIRQALHDTNLPSMAVAVARDGQIVWEEGFGWANREDRVMATEHTMYSLASISKPITATGLMVLVQRGQIDLDKPINGYLGEAKLRARVGQAVDATVRRVANHTAGLPPHFQFFYADESFHPQSRDEIIRRYANLVTAPGERYHYSNFGYGILDYVVERTCGKPFADFLREAVFLPLGMTHTSVGVGPGLESHQAIRYTPAGKPIPSYEVDHLGAMAVYGSAHDLVRFAMFHMKEHLADQRQILNDASIDAMQEPTATATTSGDSGYGIGWSTLKNRGGYGCVQHVGLMPGVSTMCRMVPDERMAVVVLANSRSELVYTLVDKITDIVLPAKEEKDAKAKRDNPQAREPFVPGAELIGEWKGKLVTYQGDQRLMLDVKDTGDIHVRLDRQLLTLLNNPSFRDGYLTGRFASQVAYDDHRGRPYFVQLELKLREGILNGAATTLTLPDEWGGLSAVTHWVQLERQTGGK